MHQDVSKEEIDEALKQSALAFHAYKKLSLSQRANLLRSIGKKLSENQEQLVTIANQETHLGEARLKNELTRTIFQLNSYGAACEEGSWMDIRIDTADTNRTPPKPDLRKMLVPLGPVIVFGASNFPFAYSTAGGDTACALAAGCTVIVKAHPAHVETSAAVAQLISEAVRDNGLPESVFIHVFGNSFEVGKALVEHPATKAVGFTGSYEGGKALFDIANKRPEPIPVFAEMGSVNPVFILPEKLKQDAASVASMVATSVTLSAGQFCTNPGILVALEGAELESFKQHLSAQIQKSVSQTMLHPGIAKSFHDKRQKALAEKGVTIVGESQEAVLENGSQPTIASVPASVFLENTLLHKEVFGPYSLLVVCKSSGEMTAVAAAIEGQLTCTLIATETEVQQHPELVDQLKEKCGRLICNGVPTGVEVALSMHHGGPFPATTDSRFTAVGADGIKRFARPVCFQNWPAALLPEELQNDNPLRIWRTVNGQLTRDKIS